MLKRNALIATLLAVGLVTVTGAVRAQQKNTSGTAKAITLTPLDYIEIRQLVNRYGFAVDTGSNNGFDYADLFAADGEFMRPYARGREQLAALARGGRLGSANTVHYILNHVIEPTPDGAVGKEYLVELNWDLTSGDQSGRGQGQRGGQGQGQGGQAQGQARANQDQGAQAQRGSGQGNGGRGGPVSGWDQIGRKAGELARTGGHYEDVYVKTSDGWRFKKRDFIPSKSGVDAAPLAAPRIPANAGSAFPAAPPANFIPPTKQSTLTAADYLQIEQLVSSYGHALDSGYGKGENGEAYANLYTPDASFAGAVGHDKLVVLGKIQPRGPDYVRHFLTNHVVEPTPEGAKGKEYLVVIDVGENGQPSSLFLGGHYEETYRKTADGWRMKDRRLFPPRPGPQPQDATPAAAAPSSLRTEQNLAQEGKASGLPVKDHVEIQQLVARASYALDTAAEKGRAFSRLFTGDGVLKTATSQPIEVKGQEQLAAFAAGDLAHRGPFYVRDYVTNHLIHQSPGGATGRAYLVWIEVGENGNPGIVQGGGRYDDVYVKTSEGWRIKSRTFVPSKLGPRSEWEFVSAQ